MSETRVLTRNVRPGAEPPDLAAYERAGGYASLRRALREIPPAELVTMVQKSGLRGRGGAGFSTGDKWKFVPPVAAAARPRYLVCNADEMEPGTFKDRVLLEGDPHLLIEGMILAAWAIQADVGYIFLRWAYRVAAHRIEKALAEAHDAGLLGPNVLGSGWGFELHLHVSAGRYICGEETALLNALEGKRAIPRAKPPFPQVSGLWGKPTVVQNVETFCCVPHVVERGADGFRALAKTSDAGTKLYGISGKAKRPGCWELPMGTTLGEMLDEHAGGMQDGLTLRGFLPGGASTDFLGADQLDLPLDFDHVAKAGSRMGTGTAILLDDQTCPVGMVLSLERFFARESCGWCTPCRDGLPWVEKLLVGLEEGRGKAEDLDVLRMHTRCLGPGRTFCALAPGAMEPLQSALALFGEDFERHVTEGGCPWR